MATTVGTITLIAKIDTSQYKKGVGEVNRANQQMESQGTKSSSNLSAGFAKVAKVGLMALAAAAISVGALIVKNIGSAVNRVDTLNNFPKVMANLGYGAKEATLAIKTLDKGVQGLPTSLDSIASALQNIAPSSKSLGEATELTLALNNALLAGGKSADIQATGMEQFSQAIAKGKPDMMEWRSLATAMPGQLKQISQKLGYSNWQQMAAAVSDGTLSFDKVKESIMSLNKEGLGKLPSFAEQAKNATEGLGTGWTQLNTAITRGISKIITAIGSKGVSSGMASFGKVIEQSLTGIANVITNVMTFLAPFIAEFQKFFGEIMKNQQVVDGFKIVLLGIGIAIGAIVAIIVLAAIGIAAVVIGIGYVIGWLKDTIVDFVTSAATNITKFVVGFINKFNLLRTGLSIIWNNIKAVIFNTVMTILVFIRAYINTIKSIWSSGWAAIGNFVRTTWNNIVSAVSNGVNNVISFVRNIPNTVRALFSNAGSWLINAGKDMINGLINGIKNGAGAVKDAVLNIAKGAEGAIKDFFGIKSPSKMFAGIGSDLMQGLSNGIAGGGRGVVNAMNGINGSLSSAALSSISSPSISPVSVSGITGSATIEGSTENPIVNNIGTINVASDVDAERLLQRLTNNSEVISKGLTPTRSYL